MANPCVIPAKAEDIGGDNRWLNQHEYHLQLARESEPEVVLIGDSLICFLTQTKVWHDLFEPLHCLNFGIGGDKVQHCQWRVQDGILDNIKPKVVVILVGTNNTEDLPANIVAGLLELTKLVQSKLPNSDIILLELLPRGRNMNKLWEKNITTNAALQAALASNPLGPKVHLHRHKEEDFVINGNQISTADFFDYLHLSESGNRKVFTPVYERIKKILTELDKVGDVL